MFCKKCGKEINDKSVVCVHCGGAIVAAQQTPDQPSGALRILLPVGRSGYAIMAGYLGLFAVLGIFAPFAILFGILGILDIRKNKDKHGMGRAVFGIAMGAISIIAYLYVFMLLHS